MLAKAKQHYNENGLYYWLFSISIPMFFIIGKFLINILLMFNTYLSGIIYWDIWKINTELWLVLIILWFLFLFFLIFKMHVWLSSIYKASIIFLALIVSTFISWLATFSDYKNEIDSRILIVWAHLTDVEMKRIYSDYYNMRNKKDYQELTKNLDNKIAIHLIK